MLFCLHTALLLSPWCQTLGEGSNPFSGQLGDGCIPNLPSSPQGEGHLDRAQDYPLGLCRARLHSCLCTKAAVTALPVAKSITIKSGAARQGRTQSRGTQRNAVRRDAKHHW